jgi:hypothetical protein
MEVYFDDSHWAGESTIEATLEIEDNGRFSYDEWVHSYGSSSSARASGTWRQEGCLLFFYCEYADESLNFRWIVDQTLKAVKSDGNIEIDGYFNLRRKVEEPWKPVKKSVLSAVKSAEQTQQPQSPTIARLHFKDGRVQERQMPQSLMAGLFTQIYYRLVDAEGNVRNLFEARQSVGNNDSLVIDYDEIDMPPAEESNNYS